MSGNMSPRSAYYLAYGTYLANGGTRDGFLDLTPDEVQLMYTVTAARHERLVKDLLEGMGKILGGMFGGLENG